MHFQLSSNFTHMDAVDDFIIPQTPSSLGIVVVFLTVLIATMYCTLLYALSFQLLVHRSHLLFRRRYPISDISSGLPGWESLITLKLG
jgi:hypothetical protein